MGTHTNPIVCVYVERRSVTVPASLPNRVHYNLIIPFDLVGLSRKHVFVLDNVVNNNNYFTENEGIVK